MESSIAYNKNFRNLENVIMLFFDEPIIEPPKDQKSFPIIWIRNLRIAAHDPAAEGSVYLELLPMSENGELFWGNGSIQITSTRLFQAINEVPELAAAYQAILSAVKPLQAWVESQQTEENP